MAYEQIAGPLGPARADAQAALVASVIANANRGKGRRFTPADFMPAWDRQPQSLHEQIAAIKAHHRRLGGTTNARG
ncbi:DUF4035 domain-containing protein [Actinocorallia sp. API 0066]|uniref:phage tail assembly protein T n=1 Tax=Actinocorallia sp. API 0066 TaxID=2896846 RepID=UPI001E5ACAD8|nr:DUF4035 domain-containing protein [Actinocorallia sp. API 0066]MCD0450763.1 DUF4035 domain-containing protein [Actinocorallia sp. API 0066]